MNAAADGIDVETLMARVRERLASGATIAGIDELRRAPPPSPDAAPPFVGVVLDPPPLPVRERYALDELTAFRDVAFVRATYHAVLGREPDGEGLANWLGHLREGRLSKAEIVAQLRRSPEGRHRGVRIDGLWRAYALRRAARVPVVGTAYAWFVALARLPRFVRHVEHYEAYADYERRRVADELSAMQGRLGSRLDALESGLVARERARGEDESRAYRLVDRLAAEKASRQELADEVAFARAMTEARVDAIEKRLQAAAAAQDEARATLEQQLRDGAVELHALARDKAGIEALDGLGARLDAAVDALRTRVREIGAETARKGDGTAIDARHARLAIELGALSEVVQGIERRLAGGDAHPPHATGHAAAASAPLRESATPHTADDLIDAVLPAIRIPNGAAKDAAVLVAGSRAESVVARLRLRGVAAREVVAVSTSAGRPVAGAAAAADAGPAAAFASEPADSAEAVLLPDVAGERGYWRIVALVDDARRVLRDGGALVATMPHPDDGTFRRAASASRGPAPESLVALLRARGFREVVTLRLPVSSIARDDDHRTVAVIGRWHR